ncbi:hypothetical protein JPSP35_22520 [Staphylococcus pseudintermedius]
MNDVTWKDLKFIGFTRSQKAKMIHKGITPSIALSRYKNYWSIDEIVNTKPYMKRRRK